MCEKWNKIISSGGFFSKILISIKGVKMKLRIPTKKYEAAPTIRIPTKAILGPSIVKGPAASVEVKLIGVLKNFIRYKLFLSLFLYDLERESRNSNPFIDSAPFSSSVSQTLINSLK